MSWFCVRRVCLSLLCIDLLPFAESDSVAEWSELCEHLMKIFTEVRTGTYAWKDDQGFVRCARQNIVHNCMLCAMTSMCLRIVSSVVEVLWKC